MRIQHKSASSRPKWTSSLTALCILGGVAFAQNALADDHTAIDYPESGVALGQGWNSFGVTKTSATCIIFQKAEAQPGQRKNMTMRAVTSRYQLDNELGISASASYKGVTASVSGKVDYSKSVKIETNGTSVAALARVDNGNIYVGTPSSASASKIAQLIEAGKTPDEVNAAVGETAAQVAARMAAVLPGLSSDDIETRHTAFDIKKINAAVRKAGDMAGAIRLAPEFEELAKLDPVKFRKVCGDSYVATISQGGDLSMLFNFETKSVQKQQDIAASLKGSGWGVTAEASMKSKIASAAEGTTTTMSYNQTGGSGDPIPTNLDQLYEKIHDFPAVIEKAPFNYMMQLGRYEDLINWPSGAQNNHASYAAIDGLIYRASVWSRLNTVVSGILNDSTDPFGPESYLLGRGVSRATLVNAQAEIKAKHDAVKALIENCLKNADASPPCKPAAEVDSLGQSLDALTAEEMTYRAMLPLPLVDGINPPQRTSAAGPIQETLYKLWIQKVNAARCELNGTPVCLTVKDAEAYKAKIKVTPTALFVVYSNKLNHACMKPAATKSLVNLSEGCSFADPNLLFRWDAPKKHLVHNNSGKCLNVRGGSKKDKADIILFKCQGSAKKYANDRWSLPTVSKANRWYRIKNQKSDKCAVVTGEVRSGRRLTQYNCTKSTGKSMVWRFVMQ